MFRWCTPETEELFDHGPQWHWQVFLAQVWDWADPKRCSLILGGLKTHLQDGVQWSRWGATQKDDIWVVVSFAAGLKDLYPPTYLQTFSPWCLTLPQKSWTMNRILTPKMTYDKIRLSNGGSPSHQGALWKPHGLPKDSGPTWQNFLLANGLRALSYIILPRYLLKQS